MLSEHPRADYWVPRQSHRPEERTGLELKIHMESVTVRWEPWGRGSSGFNCEPQKDDEKIRKAARRWGKGFAG